MNFAEYFEQYFQVFSKMLLLYEIDVKDPENKDLTSSFQFLFLQSLVKASLAHWAAAEQPSMDLLSQMGEVISKYSQSLSDTDRMQYTKMIDSEQARSLTQFFQQLTAEIPEEKRKEIEPKLQVLLQSVPSAQ
ncbi:hypothetical protein KBC79_04375 [Candidatus Woesebacteria bacterium]|nr:hypothetical protein [Candidatus Woesebacteria bacterium]